MAPIEILMLTMLCTPVALMALAALLSATLPGDPPALWKRFHRMALLALAATVAGLLLHLSTGPASILVPGLAVTTPGVWMAALVQFLGVTIAAFSGRYLQGEADQARFVAAFAGVLAAVQVLLLADHWLVLIVAWSAVGAILQRLLCFYADRPFAVLAAYKKRIADRLADALLLLAAALAWSEVGNGSLSALDAMLAQGEPSTVLQISAIALSFAVILRSGLLPTHGWLIQVMEAPTPVSALLHAGVVNLGGFVLIRFAPLLEAVPLARFILVSFGLVTAVLAGLVMLTRVSIKLRLAWSTVAQMGFLILECALGLYSFALLHLIGHSLYKAHSFLMASDTVRQTRLRAMQGSYRASTASLVLAPVLMAVVVIGLLQGAQLLIGVSGWPWWWTGVIALAWAPLLWLPTGVEMAGGIRVRQLATGLLTGAGLTMLALLVHALPLGLTDRPETVPGVIVLGTFVLLYLLIARLQHVPGALEGLRRWSYGGFYLDEWYTRLALRLRMGLWLDGAGRASVMQPDLPAAVAVLK